LTRAIAEMADDERREVEDFALAVMKKAVAMRRGMEAMAGFDEVLADIGIDPADFVRAIVAEVKAGFKLSATPGSVHTFKGIILPGIVRAGLVSERVRPLYERAEITLFADTAVLEEFERTGDVRA
jgi:hypothetical protein